MILNNSIEINVESNVENSVDEETYSDSLENKLKKALVKYKFGSFENKDGTVTLTATTTGNAQYSIADDVYYEYIRNLLPVAYKDDSVDNVIFKVTISDNSNSNLDYTYGCSLSKQNYQKYN